MATSASSGSNFFNTLHLRKGQGGKGILSEPQIPSSALSGSGSTGIFSAHTRHLPHFVLVSRVHPSHIVIYAPGFTRFAALMQLE
ncbi:hypothetical protein MJ579_04890 [Klebsiella pneumoniae]|nr:hypothetical protein MJ579_04890 [Klebsiella pneumoniae]